jgi:ABC-type sulfate transport system substrate-binding protein
MCTDIDECDTETSPCDAGFVCENNAGSFSCGQDSAGSSAASSSLVIGLAVGLVGVVMLTVVVVLIARQKRQTTRVWKVRFSNSSIYYELMIYIEKFDRTAAESDDASC